MGPGYLSEGVHVTRRRHHEHEEEYEEDMRGGKGYINREMRGN